MARSFGPQLLGAIPDYVPPPVVPEFEIPERTDPKFNALWNERLQLLNRTGLYRGNFNSRVAINQDALMNLEVTKDNYGDLKRLVDMKSITGVGTTEVRYQLKPKYKRDLGRESGYQTTLSEQEALGKTREPVGLYDPTGEGRMSREQQLDRYYEMYVDDTRQWASENQFDKDLYNLLASKVKTYELKRETEKMQYRTKMQEEFEQLRQGLSTKADENIILGKRRGTNTLNTQGSAGGLGIPQ